MSEKPEPEQFRKLFVFGLNYETAEEALKKHFEQWGEIVDCVVMRKLKNSNRSRGFGYVTYKSANMVDDAQAARPHKIDGREVKSKRAVPREDSHNPAALVTVNKLYVSGIKDDLTEEDLRDCFGSYGNILSVNIVVDKNTGKRRGIAFVEFDDHDPVDKICLQRNHTYKDRKLEVKKALSRDEMNKIKMKQEMRSYASGGGEWRAPDEFDRGGYGGGRYGGGPGNGYSGGYGNGYGGGYGDRYGGGGASAWSDSYGDSYYGGGGGGWGTDFGSSYGGGPMRSTYSQRSQFPYGGGRASERYGGR